jgi:hypothetical protein
VGCGKVVVRTTEGRLVRIVAKLQAVEEIHVMPLKTYDTVYMQITCENSICSLFPV